MLVSQVRNGLIVKYSGSLCPNPLALCLALIDSNMLLSQIRDHSQLHCCLLIMFCSSCITYAVAITINVCPCHPLLSSRHFLGWHFIALCLFLFTTCDCHHSLFIVSPSFSSFNVSPPDFIVGMHMHLAFGKWVVRRCSLSSGHLQWWVMLQKLLSLQMLSRLYPFTARLSFVILHDYFLQVTYLTSFLWPPMSSATCLNPTVYVTIVPCTALPTGVRTSVHNEPQPEIAWPWPVTHHLLTGGFLPLRLSSLIHAYNSSFLYLLSSQEFSLHSISSSSSLSLHIICVGLCSA